jgi:hypothetical protein
MNWQGHGRKQSQINLVYYPVSYPEGLRKTMKIPPPETRSMGRDFKSGTPEYEVVFVLPWPRHSIDLLNIIFSLSLLERLHRVI